jgi:hypothetical protein
MSNTTPITYQKSYLSYHKHYPHIFEPFVKLMTTKGQKTYYLSCQKEMSPLTSNIGKYCMAIHQKDTRTEWFQKVSDLFQKLIILRYLPANFVEYPIVQELTKNTISSTKTKNKNTSKIYGYYWNRQISSPSTRIYLPSFGWMISFSKALYRNHSSYNGKMSFINNQVPESLSRSALDLKSMLAEKIGEFSNILWSPWCYHLRNSEVKDMTKKSKFSKVFTCSPNISKKASNLIKSSQYLKRNQEKKYSDPPKTGDFLLIKHSKFYPIWRLKLKSSNEWLI